MNNTHSAIRTYVCHPGSCTKHTQTVLNTACFQLRLRGAAVATYHKHLLTNGRVTSAPHTPRAAATHILNSLANHRRESRCIKLGEAVTCLVLVSILNCMTCRKRRCWSCTVGWCKDAQRVARQLSVDTTGGSTTSALCSLKCWKQTTQAVD